MHSFLYGMDVHVENKSVKHWKNLDAQLNLAKCHTVLGKKT
jgi:hypothetical protein